jgi:hypothetical protein
MIQDHMSKEQLEVIDEKFEEWHDASDPISSRINIFNKLLNIPYGINLNIHDIKNCNMIFGEKIAHCIPKHFVLAYMLQKLDMECRLVSIPFNWRSISNLLNEGLQQIAKNLSPSLHMACECKINDKWILIDCSWDPILKDAGFPVNDNWDGFSNTILAVNPEKIIIHNSVDDRLDLDKRFNAQDNNKLKFFSLFNKYLDKIRLQIAH